MIASFADKRTLAIHQGRGVKGVPSDIAPVVRRKLRLIDPADQLNDLRSPPGNRLQPLSGDLIGLHSIRVNDQWRLTFVWRDGDAYEVCLQDYH